MKHPEYKHDSVVSPKIAFDLVKSIMLHSNVLQPKPSMAWISEKLAPTYDVSVSEESFHF